MLAEVTLVTNLIPVLPKHTKITKLFDGIGNTSFSRNLHWLISDHVFRYFLTDIIT
jgi:hypothetical protein